jgi:hypothetical protein
MRAQLLSPLSQGGAELHRSVIAAAPLIRPQPAE